MGLLNKTLSVLGFKGAEGAYREGPYALPVTGGVLSAEAGQYMNWWQLGYDVERGGGSAMVEACVSAYAQTVAMCPGNHWRWAESAGRKRVPQSALTRLLRYPNAYQSISDFLLNAVRSLLLEGNAYALALRNDRYEITELHLMRANQCRARVAADGEVFYQLAGNEVVDRMVGGDTLMVPRRDVLHLRLHTPRHPLVGETPLQAAALQLAAGNTALTQQVQFFLNQSRPSFLLTTDQVLTVEQVAQLRERWNEQSRGMARGSTPILTAGLKAQPISVNAVDAQLADILKISDEAIATVFRIPMQIFGRGGNVPVASTEALMQQWLATGLGFVLNHVEEALGLLFKLSGQPDEYIEFDTAAIQRSAFKDRVEAWAAGTRGGLFARNEARREFELAPVEGGDEPWVQQQDIPLSVAEQLANALTAPAPTPALPEPVNDDEAQAAAALDFLRKGLA